MKRVFVFLLVIALAVLPVSAAGEHVYDEYGLMDAEQAAQLESFAAQVSEAHGFDVIVHTVEDYRSYGYSDLYDYAEHFYKSQGCREDGSMLVLSMAERDYCVIFSGTVGAEAFTETGRDDMEMAFLGFFRGGDYPGGFRSYIDSCDRYLTAYEQGSPVGTGTDHSQEGYVPYYDTVQEKPSPALALIPGIIAAVITGVCMAIPMRSAKEKQNASDYSSRLNLTRRQDMFLHRTVTRTPKPQNNGSSGGGGSFHHSSGSTMSGRSGKF